MRRTSQPKTITTLRGTVVEKHTQQEFMTKVTYEVMNIKWLEEDRDIEEAVDRLKDVEFSSEYANTYKEALEKAYVTFGRDGVCTNIRYILSNIEEDGTKEDLDKLHEALIFEIAEQ